MLSGAVAGGVFIEDDRHVRPESLIRGLVAALERRGVEIRADSPVSGFLRDGRDVAAALTAGGGIEADRFVIAAGAWSGPLAREAGFPLPLEAGKGYSITVEEPSYNLRQPLDLIEARAALTPFDGALRLAGTMELSGVNLRYDRRRAEAIWRNAHRYLNETVSGKRMRAWVGMRPMTPDGLPVIGRLPGSDNLYVATAHQMLGVTLAPTTAHALARLMHGEAPGVNLMPFDPLRFV
jgi:D-amino-acid dehydrogenase